MKKSHHVLLFLLLFLSGFAQNTLKGKLILPKKEYIDLVVGKTKVLIRSDFHSKIFIDSTLVDENLSFTFPNIPNDNVTVSFSPGGFPSNIAYNVNLKKGKTTKLKVKYSPICMYSETDSICPKCKKNDKTIPIVYGLIILKNKEKDGETVKLGGCVSYGCDPHWYCRRDKYKF